MRRYLWLAIVSGLGLSFFYASSGVSEPATVKRSTHEMMREKLAIAQQLFRSVATEDYATTEKQAAALAQLTRDAAWMAYRTDQYRMESVEFERSAYQLAAAAREKKLGETTLGFLGVTLSCVRCHRYLREAEEIESREITVPAVQDLPAGNETTNLWMKKKLELSEAVLSGLAVGDAESIQKNAEIMQTLSAIEGWSRRKDAQEYRILLNHFRDANKELIDSAAEKDLDGAALAFTQVTLSCVKCHHHLRLKAEQPEQSSPE